VDEPTLSVPALKLLINAEPGEPVLTVKLDADEAIDRPELPILPVPETKVKVPVVRVPAV